MDILPIQLDKRTKEEIIHQMEELANSYTPEWKFHPLQPDPGSVLMNIYGDMLMDTIYRYNRIPERDMIHFFQYLGTEQRSGEPAKGYVSLGMVDPDVACAEVPRFTGIFGTAENGDQVRLETQKDILVSTGEVKAVYYADGASDCICLLAEEEGPLLTSGTANQQEHICWIGHSVVFFQTGEAEIRIMLTYKNHRQDWKQLLSDPEKTEFSYLSDQGEWRFADWKIEGNMICLHKSKEMPEFLPTMMGGKESCFIKWQAKDIQAYADFALQELLLGSTGVKRKPEFIYTADGQESNSRCYPFGERPYIYSECYICSNEVFGKKGALIELSLNMEFRRVSLLVEPVPQPIQWKTIMKQSDFSKEEQHAITVGEVVWEYYNGLGFTRLFSEPLYADIFLPTNEEEQEKTVTLTWNCPQDIEPFLVNAKLVYCIRVRVVRIHHEYTRAGYYQTPFLTRAELSYDYQSVMQKPEVIGFYNNLEERWNQGGKVSIPFLPLKDRNPALYIGLSQPLDSGPYGLYCGVPQRNVSVTSERWNYEYYSDTEWKSLMLEDDTENLKKNGVLIPFGNQRFRKKVLFGRELYWIRIIRLPGRLEEHPDTPLVPIQQLWMNTVPVLVVETAQGGGKQGNLGPGQAMHLERSIRFLSQVTNRYALTGGKDPELPEEAMKRTSNQLLHQDRAIMLSDYEALAKEASRAVAKAKAYSNCNEAGDRERGAVTLVVLQEDYQEENADFQGLQDRIGQYIQMRMPGLQRLQNHFYIIQPWITEIQVTALCTLKPHNSVFQCKAEAEKQLSRFLNPLTGNSDGRGWEIGSAPNREQIRNVLLEVQGIESIQTLIIKAYCYNHQGIQEIDLEGRIPKFQIVTSGIHKIRFEEIRYVTDFFIG